MMNIVGESLSVNSEEITEGESLFSQLMDSSVAGETDAEGTEENETSDVLKYLSGVVTGQLTLSREPQKMESEHVVAVEIEQDIKGRKELILPNAPIISEVDKTLLSDSELDGTNQVLGDKGLLNPTQETFKVLPLSKEVAPSELKEVEPLLKDITSIKANILNQRSNEMFNQTTDGEKLASSLMNKLSATKGEKAGVQAIGVFNHREILDETSQLANLSGQPIEGEINVEMDGNKNATFSEFSPLKEERVTTTDYKAQPGLTNGEIRSEFSQMKTTETPNTSTQTVVWENQSEFEELMIRESSMMKDGDKTTMVIKLKPYTLGEMKISLEMNDGKLKALIQLEESESKKIVEESLKMLHGELKTSIIEVEQMQPSSKDGSNYEENRQQQKSHYEDDKHRSKDKDEFEQLLNELNHSNVEILV